MTVDIDAFAASETAFALRFTRADLPGLLSKKLVVPEGHVALVRTEGGEASVLAAGNESADLAEAVLVKIGINLEFELDAGMSQDNLAFQAKLGLSLAPAAKTIDLQQLERTLLREGEVGGQAVHDHFLPYVRDAVRFFVSKRSAEDLGKNDPRGPLTEHLREELKKALFETGFELKDVTHPSLSSAQFEERRKASARQAQQASALDHERQMLELKKQLDKEALLADIEVRDEASRARKEKRLERFEQLRQQMGDDDRKALIMMLDDDKQRAVLIRELIEQDMTPEQRATLQVSEMEQRVEERLIELQQKLAQLTGAELQRRDTDPITRRVLCVVGKRVLGFDPKTNLHPEVPKEVHETEDGNLGYLRSVRQETVDGESYLLAGAQRGIYRLHGTQRWEYNYPREPAGKGGANAVAYFDGRLFATHSEIGLVEWPWDGKAGRNLCESVLDGAGSVRGAVVSEGRLFFSAGNDIFALDVATGAETPTRFKGSDDSITSFHVHRDELVAGNRSGKLYRWSLDDPNSPQAFGVVKKNPIFMLRHAQIAGQGFFVIGSKDFTVTACEPKKDLYREYQAREEVRWVDAAADFVFGVSRSGYKVFCWDTLRQSEPKLTIRVSDKVQDIFVVKMLPASA